MDFKEFKDYVADHVKEFLPEAYQDAIVDIRENMKLNEQYTALQVHLEEDRAYPSINLTDLYQKYGDKEPSELSEMFEHIAGIIGMDPLHFDMNRLTDYDQAKESLFIRVSSLENNWDILKDVPHQNREDLVITYHIMADIGGDGMASTMVTNQMMEHFGITADQLHADAVANSPKILPDRVESMGTVMRRIMSADMLSSGMGQEDVDRMMDSMGMDDSNPMTVVSNEQGMNGASALFYPGQFDAITEKMQGDYFILPSSIHEVLVLPDNGEFDTDTLRGMVTEINATQVAPNERLTDEVYHYDSQGRIFEKAATFDERVAKRDQEKVSEKQTEYGEKAPGKDAVEKAAKPKKNHDMSL